MTASSEEIQDWLNRFHQVNVKNTFFRMSRHTAPVQSASGILCCHGISGMFVLGFVHPFLLSHTRHSCLCTSLNSDPDVCIPYRIAERSERCA